MQSRWRWAVALLIGLVAAKAWAKEPRAIEGAPTPGDPEEAAIVRSVCRPPDCVRSCGDGEAGRLGVTDVERGGFSARGEVEALVSLFPCHEMKSLRQRGTLALVRRGPKSWRQVAATSDALFPGECRVQRSPDRDLLLCQVGVGPNRGILTDSLCAVFWRAGKLTSDCPIVVSDVSAAGCFSGPDARPRTWTARISSWEERPFGPRPGAAADVEFAIASPRAQGSESVSDAACERAMRRLEKQPRQRLRLEAVFDGKSFALTPESEALKKQHGTMFE